MTMTVAASKRGLFAKVSNGSVSVHQRDGTICCSAKCAVEEPVSLALNKTCTFVAVCDRRQILLFHRPVESVLKLASLQLVVDVDGGVGGGEDDVVFMDFHPCSPLHLVVLTAKGQLSVLRVPRLHINPQSSCNKRVCSPQDYSLRCKSAAFVPALNKTLTPANAFAMFVLLESGEVMLLNPVTVDDSVRFDHTLVKASMETVKRQLQDVIDNPTEFPEYEYEDLVKTASFLRALADTNTTNSLVSFTSDRPQGPFAVHPEPVERLLSTSHGIKSFMVTEDVTVVVCWCLAGRLDVYVLLDRLPMRWLTDQSSPVVSDDLILYLIDSVVTEQKIVSVCQIAGLESDFILCLADKRHYLLSTASIIKKLTQSDTADLADLKVDVRLLDVEAKAAFYDDSLVDGVIIDDCGRRLPMVGPCIGINTASITAITLQPMNPITDDQTTKEQLSLFANTVKKCQTLKDAVQDGRLTVNDLELLHQQLTRLTSVVDSSFVPAVNGCLERVSLLLTLCDRHKRILTLISTNDPIDSKPFERTNELQSRVQHLLDHLHPPTTTDTINMLSDLALKLRVADTTEEEMTTAMAQLRLVKSIKQRLSQSAE